MFCQNLQCFNHTDPTNTMTPSKDLPTLNNRFWKRLSDRLRSITPTKGDDLKPTSSNTIYARSETRECDPATGKGAATRIDQYEWNFIAVREALVDLGPSGKAITLQWHGDSTRPLTKAQWYLNDDKKTCRLNWQRAPEYKGNEDEDIIIDGVPLNVVFDLAFAFNKDTVEVFYNWNAPDAKHMVTKLGTSYKKDKGLYAKFGGYIQTDITKTKIVSGKTVKDQKEGQGIIDIFDYQLHHGAKIELPDFDKTAFWRVGEDASTAVRTEQPGTAPVQTPAPTPTPTPTPAPTPAPVPTPQPTPAPSTPVATPAADELTAALSGISSADQAKIKPKMTQVQTLLSQKKGKDAKVIINAIEDIADSLDEKTVTKLRAWTDAQRAVASKL